MRASCDLEAKGFSTRLPSPHTRQYLLCLVPPVLYTVWLFHRHWQSLNQLLLTSVWLLLLSEAFSFTALQFGTHFLLTAGHPECCTHLPVTCAGITWAVCDDLCRYNLSHLEQWLRDNKLQDTNVQYALDPIVQASQLLQARKTDADVDCICEMCSQLTPPQVARSLLCRLIMCLQVFSIGLLLLWTRLFAR